jgi:hypothetical protein
MDALSEGGIDPTAEAAHHVERYGARSVGRSVSLRLRRLPEHAGAARSGACGARAGGPCPGGATRGPRRGEGRRGRKVAGGRRDSRGRPAADPLLRASHGTVGAGAPSTAKSARPRCGTPRSARFTAAPHVTVTGGTAQSLVGQTTRPDRIQQHTYARCTGSRVTAVGHSWRATSSSRSPTRTDATPRQPPHRECCPPG